MGKRTSGLGAWLEIGVLVVCGGGGWAQGRVFAQTKPPTTGVAVQVPFVGCASDGQVGPLAAPKGTPRSVPITTSVAQRLSYYEAENGPGVVGPRGWHCFGTYGSNGASLFLSPQPIKSADLFSESWKGFDGPVVQVSISDGGTSGRFEVAEVIARVFPAYVAFTQKVIADGIEPASDFPIGPYPSDKLTYISKKIVEFQTPANADGLGTRSRLLKNGFPIQGAAILDLNGDTSLTQISIRLPEKMSDLAGAIVKETERETAQLKK